MWGKKRHVEAEVEPHSCMLSTCLLPGCKKHRSWMKCKKNAKITNILEIIRQNSIVQMPDNLDFLGSTLKAAHLKLVHCHFINVCV